MHPHRVNVKYIVGLSTIVSVIVAYLLVHVWNQNFFSLAVKVGIISQIPTALWALYERHIWRLSFINIKLNPLYLTNLNGRWEGSVQRTNELDGRPFVMEIRQTYTRIKYKTYSNSSSGESLNIAIMRGSDAEDIKLYCYWETSTQGLEDKTLRDAFKGFSVMDLKVEGGKMYLDDSYFTERNPPTRGRLRVQWVSKERKGRFI